MVGTIPIDRVSFDKYSTKEWEVLKTFIWQKINKRKYTEFNIFRLIFVISQNFIFLIIIETL
jgi:hypothetical protein